MSLVCCFSHLPISHDNPSYCPFHSWSSSAFFRSLCAFSGRYVSCLFLLFVSLSLIIFTFFLAFLSALLCTVSLLSPLSPASSLSNFSAGFTEAHIARTVATGYGRFSVPFADETLTEISCHAEGALLLFPQAKTIIDLGGQDSKVIYINPQNTQVQDFCMNDRCAAGTGRFLEVAAGILGTDIIQFAASALEAPRAASINATCVVFAESEVIGMLSTGVPRNEIAAGIHAATAKKIAAMVLRGRCVPPVVFTGGVARNKAIRVALETELACEMSVPSNPQLSGALGAAILAARALGHRGDLINPNALSDERSNARTVQEWRASIAKLKEKCEWCHKKGDEAETEGKEQAEREKGQGKERVSVSGMSCSGCPDRQSLMQW